jgi:hypothetical protein
MVAKFYGYGKTCSSFLKILGGIPLSFFVGAFLERYFGGRVGALMGSASFSGGIALSFFSIKISYFLLLITFGAMVSMGQGAAYTAVLVTVQKVWKIAF